MTLSIREGHLPIASLFKSNFSYLWHILLFLCICRASCMAQSVYFIDCGKQKTLNLTLFSTSTFCGGTN